jgi:hypothetical protein
MMFGNSLPLVRGVPNNLLWSRGAVTGVVGHSSASRTAGHSPENRRRSVGATGRPDGWGM